MPDLEKIAENLSELTVMEAASLVKMLEEKWGVSAAAVMTISVPSGKSKLERISRTAETVSRIFSPDRFLTFRLMTCNSCIRSAG